MSTASQPDIPVVDLSQPDSALLSLVHRACLQHGFFLVSNHGIDRSLIKHTFDVAKQFFALDESTKRKYLVNNQPVNSSHSVKEKADSSHFGYTAPFDEKLDATKQKVGNTQEGFYVGRSDQSNQFPNDELPEFKRVTEQYHAAMTRLAMRLVDLLWSAIHSNKASPLCPIDESRIETSHWHRYFDSPSAILRLLHYLPQMPSSIEDGRMGAGAHTDWDFLTILATEAAADDVDSCTDRSAERGLQIQQSGEWFDVPVVPGAFIVNIADMLARWTNDTYHSTVHRVIIQSNSDRYSIPFFFGPNSNTIVKVLASCQSIDRPIRYEPVCSGEYLQERYRQTQRHRQQQLGITTDQ